MTTTTEQADTPAINSVTAADPNAGQNGTPSYTTAWDWVDLSPVSDGAARLWRILTALTLKDEDAEVHVTDEELGDLIGGKDAGDTDPRSRWTIARYRAELEQLGALVETSSEKRSVTVPGEARPQVRTIRTLRPINEPPTDYEGRVNPFRVRKQHRAAKQAEAALHRQSDQAKQPTVDVSAGGTDVAAVLQNESSAAPESEHGCYTKEVTPRRNSPKKSKDSSSELATRARPDVEQLCERLRDRMIANGCKEPTITKAWRDEARRLLDIDGRELAKALNLIDWATGDPFWSSNIQSMSKFRQQYDKLRLRAVAEYRERTIPQQPRVSTTDQRVAAAQALKAKFAQPSGQLAIAGGAA